MSEAARDFKGDVRKFVTAIIRKYEGAHQKVSRMEEAKDAIQVCLYLCLYVYGRSCLILRSYLALILILHDWFGFLCECACGSEPGVS